MAIIAVMNQKGGCGKTTTSINLAAALSYKSKKTLIVDLDPQGHSSLGLNISAKNSKKTLYHVLAENLPLEEGIHPITEHLDILPGNILLSSLEQSLSGKVRREFRLKDIIAPLEKEYDFIFIDCPPSLGLLSINAIMASGYIIVPVEPSTFALDGVHQLSDTIKVLSTKVGHDVKVKQLISIYDIENPFANTFVEEIKAYLHGSLFKAHIHKSNHISEAAYHGMSVIEYNPESTGYIDFMSLAHEVIIWVNEDKIKTLLTKTTESPHVTEDGVYFFHKAEAAVVVQLAGSFNNWNPEQTMMEKVDSAGYWYTVVPLEKGKHHYKFVVDGRYVEDKNNPQKETSLFGVSQSVVHVGEHTD